MSNRSSGGEGALALLAVVVVFILLAAWIILAMIMRLIAWVVCYWFVSCALALVVGLVAGFVAPLLVLTGRSVSKPDIATPEKVVAQQVIRHRPVGFTKHFGWDKAWPEYIPYQALRDATAVYREITLARRWVWGKIRLRPRPKMVRPDAYGNLMPVKPAVGALSGLTWGVVVPVPFAGFVALALHHGHRRRGRLRLSAGMDSCVPLVGSRCHGAHACPSEVPSLL